MTDSATDKEYVLDGTGVIDCPHCGGEVTLRARATAEYTPGEQQRVNVDVDIEVAE